MIIEKYLNMLLTALTYLIYGVLGYFSGFFVTHHLRLWLIRIGQISKEIANCPYTDTACRCSKRRNSSGEYHYKQSTICIFWPIWIFLLVIICLLGVGINIFQIVVSKPRKMIGNVIDNINKAPLEAVRISELPKRVREKNDDLPLPAQPTLYNKELEEARKELDSPMKRIAEANYAEKCPY